VYKSARLLDVLNESLALAKLVENNQRWWLSSWKANQPPLYF
jgi:hypothetical protein